jgi:GH15 family glucan-1,4-alpha-glucosidase
VPGPGQLPAAVLGNGSLLATVSERGVVEQLSWPHPDRVRHPVRLRIGIEQDGGVRWLDDPSFAWSQSYADDAMVLRSTARSAELEVELEDVVAVDEPVLLRRVSGAANARIHAAADVVDGSLAVRTNGRLVACAFGTSSEDARNRAERFLQATFDDVVAERARADADGIAGASSPERSASGLYRRSLLVFETLADRGSGAVIAAPELDPDGVHSGGYGFVWARDLAYLTLAFLAAGQTEPARRALRWFPSAQEPSGVWLQRHWTDGSTAPSWCAHQLDETATVLFAYEAAWRELCDRDLDAELWPSARAAAEFVLGVIDGDGLPAETADLWEEREGRHAYTAAAFVGGLRAAAAAAERHEPALAGRYALAADDVRGALERRFWSDEHGRYVRTLGDPTVDVSLLGLAWPFRAVDPAGARMRATAAAVERELARPGGGILRYADDRYAGGNAWVLAALWLGLRQRQVGDLEGHRRALAYAERVATPLGLLAEQVSDDGRPVWVLPLAWSHAMFVLAARPELVVAAAPGTVVRARATAAR